MMQIDMIPDLSHGWTCMICGADRSFDDIDVQRRPMAGHEERFPEWRVNVRYCVDNPACALVAWQPGPWPLTSED